MASNRYDQRKNFEEAEANAIGTEMLRADLLPLAGRSITKRSHAPRGAIAGVAHPRNAPTSLVGQSRRIDRQPATSGLPLTTDIVRQIRLVRLVPQPDSRIAANSISIRSPRLRAVSSDDGTFIRPRICSVHTQSLNHDQSLRGNRIPERTLTYCQRQ
jgi:hypothetical protein